MKVKEHNCSNQWPDVLCFSYETIKKIVTLNPSIAACKTDKI